MLHVNMLDYEMSLSQITNPNSLNKTIKVSVKS